MEENQKPKKATAKKTTTAKAKEVDLTGFDKAGFRPVMGQIAVILTQDHIDGMTPEEEDNGKKLQIPKKPGIILPDSEVQRRKEKEATYVVACISKGVAANDDLPEVGDRIALLNGTPINEFIVNGVKYGLLPSHKVACIIKHDAKVTAD